MKTKGALFYLQAEISGNYTTIAAMQSNSMTINQETVEITDKSMLFRELLENAGIGSVSTKAQGIVSDSASYQFIKDSVISGTIINCKLLSNTGEVYSGGFLITSFESSGEKEEREIDEQNFFRNNKTKFKYSECVQRGSRKNIGPHFYD